MATEAELNELAYYRDQQLRSTSNMTMASPMNMYGSTVLMLTDPDRQVHKLELQLKGMIIDEHGNERQMTEPLMNDEGVNNMISHVLSVVNQVTIMSDLEEEHIHNLIDFLGDTVIKDLMVNSKRYECRTAVTRDKVHQLVVTTAFVCMRRSFQAGERKGIYRSIQEITTKVEANAQRNKSSFFSNLLGWNKK